MTDQKPTDPRDERIRQLKEALRPFAHKTDGRLDDDSVVQVTMNRRFIPGITVGDFRRAYVAFTDSPSPEAPADKDAEIARLQLEVETLRESLKMEVANAAIRAARLTQERDELQATFDLGWKADMRAIKLWQEAHPGNDLVWPDQARLCVWLMEQLDALQERLKDKEEGVDRLEKLVVADVKEILALQERVQVLEGALQSLQGCMPPKIFVYGAYGENWSNTEPDTDEYEEVNFEELLTPQPAAPKEKPEAQQNVPPECRTCGDAVLTEIGSYCSDCQRHGPTRQELERRLMQQSVPLTTDERAEVLLVLGLLHKAVEGSNYGFKVLSSQLAELDREYYALHARLSAPPDDLAEAPDALLDPAHFTDEEFEGVVQGMRDIRAGRIRPLSEIRAEVRLARLSVPIEASEPATCECCDRPAAKRDVNGIPLCDGCHDNLARGPSERRREHPENCAVHFGGACDC